MRAADFELIYSEHAEHLRNHIRRVVRDRDLADDVLQEVFIRVWQYRDKLPQVRSLRNWLTKIAVNLSLNALRSQNRKREILFGVTQGGVDQNNLQDALVDIESIDPQSLLLKKGGRDTLRNLISELPPDKREVLELVDQEDLTIKETSERLGIPDGTVKSRLHYGRKIVSKKIRSLLAE